MSDHHDPTQPSGGSSTSGSGVGTRSLPQIGAQFAGYRIDAVLGRGGMSVVYRADNLRVGNQVALKVLSPELSEDDAFRERFVRESRVAARLNHPNIIPVSDAGDEQGLLYIVMRYVQGCDLKALVRRDGPLALARAVGVFEQVGSALQTAHEHDLVHRDVKPANILIEQVGDGGASREHAYLADFGLTKHTLSKSGLTRTGSFLGTVDYVSPEQIASKAVDRRADIYSLGCVLYECLTGVVPFHRDADYAVLHAHLNDEPAPASNLRFDLPAGVDDVIRRAMQKAPADRYQSVREMIGDLRDVAEGAGAALASRPPTIPPPSLTVPPPPVVVAPPAAAAPPPQQPTEPAPVVAAQPPAEPPRDDSLASMPMGPPAPPPPAEPADTGKMPGRARRSVLAVAGLVALVLIAVGLAVVLSRGGNSSSATSTPSPSSSSGGTGAQLKGLELVMPAALWAACTSVPTRAKALETVGCSRPDISYEVSRYADTQQVQNAYHVYLQSRGITAASSTCPPEEWHHPPKVAGVPGSLGGHRTCFQDSNGDSWIVWTHEATNVPGQPAQSDHRDVLVIARQHSQLPTKLNLFFHLWSGVRTNIAGAIGKLRGT